MLTPPEILPREGSHLIHLLFRVEYSQWEAFDQPERFAAKTSLAKLVQEIRSTPGTQLLLFSIVTPKADIGFILLTPDLQVADAFSKRLALALGPDLLSPVFTWLSLTTSSDPDLPDWPLVCLYPVSKRRTPGQNWYELAAADRQSLMAEEARLTAPYAGRVLEMLTASTGLDDGEEFVTLFAQSSSDIQALIREKQFGAASARYTECGAFFIGLQLPLDVIYRRLSL